MLKSVTLENFESFGASQTVPLEPITVLVGPNNSGKTCFLNVGRFVRNAADRWTGAVQQEGGTENLFHRPAYGNGSLTLGWATSQGAYSATFRNDAGNVLDEDERLTDKTGGEHITRNGPKFLGGITINTEPLSALAWLAGHRASASFARLGGIVTPLLDSRFVHLSIEALRTDSTVIEHPKLGASGEGLATLLSKWRGSELKKAARLDEFLRDSIGELEHALVVHAPEQGKVRLLFEQKDGERFDAKHVSDGVLVLTALAVHALDAPRGSVVFIEEPERSIHPRRLHDVVELFRRAVRENGVQFVIATHSPVLLNEFRDEPEAVLLFRRSETGTQVRQLADVPKLRDALTDVDPGVLLADGFFTEAF